MPAAKRIRGYPSAEPIAAETAEGQATFEMANLRPERTGLPFVVFISQRGGARHDARIELARGPKVRSAEMITVALRPAPRVAPGSLGASDFDLVTKWIALNRDTLIACWDGAIEYTEVVMAALKPLPETDRA